MKVDILAIGIHPDDVELACSGTLLKHKSLGKTFGICDLTQGELGTRGTPSLRIKEADAAKDILGASFRVNLKMADGFATIDKDHLLKICRVIRQCQPDVILANAIRDRHPDHGKGAEMVRQAVFLSGLRKIELFDENQVELAPHRPSAVYHYIQDYHIEPHLVVDISPFMEKKIESIMAFKSQFYSEDASEPETPISTKDFIEFIRSRAKTLGRPIKASYGEGFLSDRYIGVDNLFDLR